MNRGCSMTRTHISLSRNGPSLKKALKVKYNLYGDLSIHLSQSPIPRPISLDGLVEADFPGYKPSPIAQALCTTFPSGLTSLTCNGNFTNSAVVPVEILTGAFLVAGVGDEATLLALCAITAYEYTPILTGNFTVGAQFLFQDVSGGE